MVPVMAFDRQHSVELCPVHSGLPVLYCGGRHNGLEDMVGVDILVGMEEAHAHILLLVVASVLVPLKLQATPHSMSHSTPIALDALHYPKQAMTEMKHRPALVWGHKGHCEGEQGYSVNQCVQKTQPGKHETTWSRCLACWSQRSQVRAEPRCVTQPLGSRLELYRHSDRMEEERTQTGEQRVPTGKHSLQPLRV